MNKETHSAGVKSAGMRSSVAVDFAWRSSKLVSLGMNLERQRDSHSNQTTLVFPCLEVGHTTIASWLREQRTAERKTQGSLQDFRSCHMRTNNFNSNMIMCIIDYEIEIIKVHNRTTKCIIEQVYYEIKLFWLLVKIKRIDFFGLFVRFFRIVLLHTKIFWSKTHFVLLDLTVTFSLFKMTKRICLEVFLSL